MKAKPSEPVQRPDSASISVHIPPRILIHPIVFVTTNFHTTLFPPSHHQHTTFLIKMGEFKSKALFEQIENGLKEMDDKEKKDIQKKVCNNSSTSIPSPL